MGSEEFLSSFERGLVALQRRIEQPSTQKPAVRYEPNAGEAGVDEVQIGVGRFPGGRAGAIDGTGICLNNKVAGGALHMEPAPPSVTDLVLDAPDQVFEAWRRIVGMDHAPEQFFGRFTLVVEDASPDSCFGLVCLLLRLAGVPSEIPVWIEHVRQWESGVIPIGRSPYEVYGSLHNALVHRSIVQDIARAWLDGLWTLCEALCSGEPPHALSPAVSAPHIDMARAFLAYEEQAYAESLSHATCIQLRLPMAGAKDRHRLVDAYLAEESLPLGSLKVFAHTDRVRPFLKSGFAVLTLYRPLATGEGFDFTISVDPHAAVELSALWHRLEEEEDTRWGAERPCGNPRQGILGYPGGTRAGGKNAPDEPWYDGRDYTLLAAPRRLKDGRLGSKLTWIDVREALWEVYQPFRDLKVRAGATALANNHVREPDLVPLEKCRPETLPADSRVRELRRTRHLFMGQWHRPDNSAPAFRVTPTLGRYLAACINRYPTTSGPVTLAELPDETSYSLVELPGGIAVVTEHGAFVLDAGRHDQVKFEPLKDEFCRACRVLHRLEKSERGTRSLLDETDGYFRGDRGNLSQEDLLRRLSREQVKLALELHRTRTVQVIPEARLFREALLARWGITDWLDQISDDVERIKDVLNSRSELLNSRHIAWFSAAALPLLFTVPLSAFLIDKLHDWKGVIGLLAGLILLNVLLFSGFLKFTEWLDRRPPSSPAR
jgi:hypothetical protein